MTRTKRPPNPGKTADFLKTLGERARSEGGDSQSPGHAFPQRELPDLAKLGTMEQSPIA